MWRGDGWRLGVVVVALAAATAGCAQGPDAETAARVAELEQEIAATETQLEAATAERDAAVPLPGAPEIDQDGEPLPEIPEVPALPVDQKSGDCPAERWALVRAWTGTGCDTYKAEISSWAEWCTPECDRPTVETRAVEIAAARCAEFCSEKGCGASVTFIPPGGCAGYDCFEPARECPAQVCQKLEYCSLLGANTVWNCFCQDLMPT